MSKVTIQGNASGTGTLTIAAPNTNTDRTLTLPDETGTVVSTASTPTFTGAVTAPSFIPNGSAVPSNGTYLPAANTLALSTNTTERMRIDSSGNVALGTTSAYGRRLFVYGGVIGNNNTNTTATNTKIAGFDAVNVPSFNTARFAAIDFYTDPSTWYYGDIRFITNDSDGTANAGTERARITSAGYLLIGYTSSNGSYKLQVNSQIFATSSTIATSDGRYKQNVIPLSGCLSDVCALNPVQFDWKKHPVHAFDTSVPTVGFIAQEVQEVLANKPYLNSIIKRNETELPDGTKEEFLGIAEGNMIALLTKAIQELNAKVEAQAAEIAALKEVK